MIKKIVITVIDSPTDDKNVKFLVGLTKLVKKTEISFSEDRILQREIKDNYELKEIIQEIINKYKEKVPGVVKFKEGKIRHDGKILLRWEYENNN